jgi:hypothetical protein
MTHGEFYSEYILDLVMSPTEVISQGWRLRKLMLLFLNSITKIGRQNMLRTVDLKRLGDISLICSYYCFMLPNHVICMFKAVELLWTEF